jgi:hypothetical protein
VAPRLACFCLYHKFSLFFITSFLSSLLSSFNLFFLAFRSCVVTQTLHTLFFYPTSILFHVVKNCTFFVLVNKNTTFINHRQRHQLELIGLSFRFSVFRPQERTKSTSLSPILVFRSRPGGGNEILLINLAPSRRRYSRILNVPTSELRNSLNVVNCLNEMKSPD